MKGSILPSLVLFLLQPSHPNDVVIIYDYTLPGVNKIVESFSERWAATTLLTATPAPDLSQLLVALTSFHTNDLRYMVLLCSANTTRTIFDMVSNNNLESRRIRWLVVGEEPDLAATLLHTLREGSLVGIASRVNNNLYKMSFSYMNHENQMRFQEVGVWTGRKGKVGKGRMNRPLYPDIVNHYRNFQGRNLISSAVDNWPFFGLKYLENDTVVSDRGIDINVINTLGYYLNFTYRVEVPPDQQWGGVQKDGTVTGIIREIATRGAHLAIDELTITASRETVVDFSIPYFFDSTTLTSKAPAERSRSLAVLYPFSSLTWIILVIVTLLMGPLGYLFSRVHHQLTQTFDSTHNERSRNVGPSFDSGRIKWGSEPGLRGVEMFCFNMFRTIIIQGNLLPASSWPLRLVFFSWYAFCVILYAVYAGTLTAYLTKPSFDKPIDSLEDLLEARERGVAPSVTVGTINEMILKVIDKNTAFINGLVGSEIFAMKQGRHLYHLARNTFHPQPYGIACPPGAPYTPVLNLMLGRMVQAGLVDKWHRDELTNMKQSSEQSKPKDQTQETEVGQGSVAVRSLALDHLQGAFYILGCFTVVAAGALLTEVIMSLYS
ncbi:hypothetical protein Pmani_015413 [Petrolisthes manimaculis]|uniref:Uncharacterized protein n=1 Tax=Petrolisthes manimaculis TaxID=1843537 RepID=A0AAE1U9X3_9EUCA|nr:hypothetical protein Pmani_015413 [Petrolisthes manimaculis]